MTPAAAATARLNAFMLFNDREAEVVEQIVHQLEDRGITTYYWRRDFREGQEWFQFEVDQLKRADSVVVLLGNARWGPNHLRLAVEAQRLNRRIVPAMIGAPQDSDLLEAGGLFRDRQYVHLQTIDDAALSRLVEAIRKSRPSAGGEHDRLIGLLVDGNEEQRADVLQQIMTSTSLDRTALSVRLRTEITQRFSAASESSFASAARDPNKMSSIRSWMLSCLIWADVEDPASRELLLAHLDAHTEPNRQVRFWTLAGLYRVKASYLEEALRLGRLDADGEIVAFARAASAPSDPAVIEAHRRALAADAFETVWQILRVLRVVPVPPLVPDVVALLDKSLGGAPPITYDALFALTHPEMAREAARLLSAQTEQLVERTIAEARTSNRNAALNFAVLLAAFDPTRVDRTLTAAAGHAGTRDVARLLQDCLRQLRREEDTGLFVAGFASDTIDVTDDRLDVQEDVQTLTAVMLSTDVKPPLAIGLFGDWGSGKSFFMRSIKAAASEMADRAARSGTTAFCSNVVSIEFNAWHYADTNLWASLVGYLLEQLAAHVRPLKPPEEQQAALVAELSSAQAAVAAITAEKHLAEQAITDRQTDLETLQIKRQRSEVRLRDLRLADLRTILADDKALKKEIETAFDKLGVPAALDSVEELNGAIADARSVKGQATALFVSIVNGGNRWLVIGLLIAIIVVIPWLARIVRDMTGSDLFARASVLLSQAVVVLGGITTVLRRGLATVQDNFGVLRAAKQRVDTLIEAKRRNPSEAEQRLEREIASLKSQEATASARLEAATARVVALEERVRALKEGRTLARFLSDRTQSDDYRKHLGLISVIRQDFNSLSDRLATGQSDIGAEFRRVDRIILFIDDLDRCPASKVIDVLQAVHLLLAYPLFVVVVGVDPRWLLDSLQATYSAFQRDGDNRPAADQDVWRVTPQNYLEKIFQIPFSLRPMTSDGYTKLIDGLMKPAPAALVHDSPASGQQAPPTPRAQEGLPAEGKGAQARPPGDGSPAPITLNAAKPLDPSAGAAEKHTRPAFVVHEESLVIKPWETAFAQRLFALIPTPRAAKRFSNIYRILKAPVDRDRLTQFEGTADFPGDFRVPMLLLAVLIGHPAEAAALFPKLLQETRAGASAADALQNLASIGLKGAGSAALQEKLEPIVSEYGFPDRADVFTQWLPRVARFSFDAARAVRITPDEQQALTPRVGGQPTIGAPLAT